jgi:hypothetical protein
MSKFPLVSPPKRALGEVDDSPIDVIPAIERRTSFFSFSYSCTELSNAGGRTQVRSRKTSLQDGKLVSESFEGELDSSAYDEQVRRAQDAVLGQVRLFMQPFTWFLPSTRKPSDRG